LAVDDPERADERVGALPLVDRVEVGGVRRGLGRGDQVTGAVRLVDDREALDVRHQPTAVGGRAVDEHPVGRTCGCCRLGAVLPEADAFLADIEVAEAVVRDAALDLGADVPHTHLPTIDQPVAVGITQLELGDAAVPGVRERREPAGGRAAVQAESLTAEGHLDAAARIVGDVRERPRIRVDAVEPQPQPVDTHDIHGARAERDRPPDVDVAEEPLGDEEKRRAAAVSRCPDSRTSMTCAC
jgi:hypothetical protein